MNDEDLIKKIKEYDFYHDIELKEGISTKSFKAEGKLTIAINLFGRAKPSADETNDLNLFILVFSLGFISL